MTSFAGRVLIGTRGSALAVTQTGLVAAELTRLGDLPADAVELVRIRTEGDRLTGSLAALGGAGVFVAALREAVLDGRCDLAVHSLKDLPTATSPGLVVAAVPEREDARDALCARDGMRLADLPHGASVGTGSPRRAAQLLAERPDLDVVDIRGNVETRLGRVAGATTGPGDLDAVVLAAAGLSRLGRLDAVTELLDPSVVMPAPGQGALAVECRSAGGPFSTTVAALDHLPTRLAVTAERALLAELEAGCAAPVGALAQLDDGVAHAQQVEGRLTLAAVVCAVDGSGRLHTSASVRLPEGRAEQLAAARDLGEQVARQLLADGAATLARVGPGATAERVLAAARGPAAHSAPLAGWRVLVPRGGEWGARVSDLLEAEGAVATAVPLIEFAPPTELTDLDSALTGLAVGVYDWVTVTSGTTVPYLSARAARHVSTASGEDPRPAIALAALLGNARIAAVGPGTAAALERIGVTPDLVPTGERSARGLLAEFPAPDPAPGASNRVLVPHSDLAEPTLADGLRAAGWQVDDVVAYRTLTGPLPAASVRQDVRSGAFDAVLLSSASTVTNLVELVGAPPESTVVCCIGPRTERAALDHGLGVHVVPDAASVEGLVDGLVQYALTHPDAGPRR